MSHSRAHGSWYNLGGRNSRGGRREYRQHHRPPGLKGKEIGLFYKNLNKNKEKKERVVSL